MYRQPHEYYDSPPPTLGYQQQVPGPSTYNKLSIGTPVSALTPEVSNSPNPHARTKTKGRMAAPGEQAVVTGMAGMVVGEDDGRIGVEPPCALTTLPKLRVLTTVGERSYTELKCLGDGSFGTVWLCDWHSPVKPDVMLSAMQCGAGARPAWAGKRLVALKRMKRVWEGGWSQARNLGELQVGASRWIRACY